MKTVQLLLIILAWSLLAGPAIASSKVDSLKRVLETHAAIDKTEVLWNIAYELFDVDNPQALFYAERAYHEVWHRGDSLQIVKVGTTYGQLLRRVGKLDKSIEVSSVLLSVARRHGYNKYVKMLLNSIGLAYMFREQYDTALEYMYESLKMKQSDSDTLGIMVALQNISLLHYKLEDCEMAYEYAHKVKSMLSQVHDSLYHRHTYLELGFIHSELGDYDSTLFYLRKGLRFTSDMDALAIIPHFHQAMAGAFLNTDRYDSAKHYARQAIIYGSRQMDAWTVANGNLILSRIGLREKDKEKSLQYLNTADSVSRLTDYSYLMLAVLKQKAMLLSAQGQFEEALRTYEEYFRKNDSVYNRKRHPRIRRVQLAFQQRENSAKIEAQSSVLRIQQESIKQQRVYLVISICFLSVILILAIELFKSNKRIKSINKMLDQRIVERTSELLSQRNELKHSVDEQFFIRTRSASELTSLVGTLKGLLYILKNDRESGKCYEEAIKVSERINDVANKIKSQDVVAKHNRTN